MKLSDLVIIESITFAATEARDDPKYGQVHSPVGKTQMVKCEFCKGTGKEEGGYIDPKTEERYWESDIADLPSDIKQRLKQIDCDFCRGEGEYQDFVSDGPEMNLANRNAHMLLDLLGIEFDHAGTIWNKDLPKLRRHIIKVLNSDNMRKAVIKPSETGGDIIDKRAVKGDNGVSQIVTRRSPKMIDSGVSEQQIERYFKDVLELIVFAQRNNYNVGWS